MREEHIIHYLREEPAVYRTYKDRVFRMLFRDKKRLLTLYNALNGTDYTEDADLMVNTLENAIFMKMKNDISFVIDDSLCLYEHQSSYCPNMPLRGFLYFADLYKKMLPETDLGGSRKIMLPTPRYLVFYNGLERTEEEFTQKLSDAYEGEGGCMELTVQVINVNRGKNRKLMERCRALSDYAEFVAKVRENLKSAGMEEAVRKAVDDCIEQDILKEFLTEQKSEVIAMSIYEYNEEYVKRTMYEDGYDAGYDTGYGTGEKCFAQLTQFLIDAGRIEDLRRATTDSGYRRELMEQFQIEFARTGTC